jgi:hypothetical protein
VLGIHSSENRRRLVQKWWDCPGLSQGKKFGLDGSEPKGTPRVADRGPRVIDEALGGL